MDRQITKENENFGAMCLADKDLPKNKVILSVHSEDLHSLDG